MGKFKRLMEVLREEEIAHDSNVFQPAPAPDTWLSLAHSRTYVDQVLGGHVAPAVEKAIGFPMNASVAMRARCATAGSVLTGRLALEYGLAANTAGGSHHARHEQGAGFCVFNDVAVAIHVLQAEGLIASALIIDLDVHQGDGTARIFEGDDSVFTLSIHAERNYPDEKAISNLDIGLPDRTSDETYLKTVRDVVPRLIAQGRPDIIFFNAGVDPHHEDRLGRLNLSDQGLQKRDRFIIETVRGAGIPLACVIGGGYAYDVNVIAKRHATLHRAAAAYLNGFGKTSEPA